MVARLSSFVSDVLGTVLAGFSTASSAVVTAADTVLGALGKLQAQVSLRALILSPTFLGGVTSPTISCSAAGTGTGLGIGGFTTGGTTGLFAGQDGASINGTNINIKSWWGFGIGTTCAGQTVPPGLNTAWFDTRAGTATYYGNTTVGGTLRAGFAQLSTSGTTTTLAVGASICALTSATPAAGGTGFVVGDRLYDAYNNVYTASAVTSGVITSIAMNGSMPFFFGFGGNPVALTAVSPSAGTGCTVNLTSTSSNTLALNPSGTTTTATPASNDNSTKIATTAYYAGQAGTANPVVNGTVAPGTSLLFARQDHVHPTDTTLMPLIGGAFTGVVTAPNPPAFDNGTRLATTNFVKTQVGTRLLLTGGTMTGVLTLAADPVGVLEPATKQYVDTGMAATKTRVAMAANNIDCNAGTYFTKTISGATALTISNTPPAGTLANLLLELTNGGSAAITWPSGMKWPSATPPTLTSAGVDMLELFQTDPLSALINDGITWNTRALPSSSNWNSVAYGGGMFVAVAGAIAVSTVAASSPDGITWTARTLPSSSAWYSVTYGGGLFVAVAPAGNAAASSSDGITWTARTLPSAQGWQSVAYGGGMFVAVAGSSGAAASSPDGITWTARTLPSSSNWFSVTYGGGMFVAVAQGGTVAASSPDGITWTARTLPSSSSWYAVAYGNGVFVAVASGTAAAASSPDGITWTARTLPSSNNWQSVAYGGGMFVAVAFGTAAAASSPDGITWTARTLPSSNNWQSVAYGGGSFVTVAFGSAAAATSTSGTTTGGWRGILLAKDVR